MEAFYRMITRLGQNLVKEYSVLVCKSVLLRLPKSNRLIQSVFLQRVFQLFNNAR